MNWCQRLDFLLPLPGRGPAGEEGAHVFCSGGDDDKAACGEWKKAHHLGSWARPLPLGWESVTLLWGSLLGASEQIEGIIRRFPPGFMGRLHSRGGMT